MIDKIGLLNQAISIDPKTQFLDLKEGGLKEGRKSSSFSDFLQASLAKVNENQVTADKAAMDLASGKNENIHETMLAAAQAELSFNLMVQIRNKALEAYQEVMRMQV